MKERSASKPFFRRRQKDASPADAADSPDTGVDFAVHHNDLISSTSTSWFASPQMAHDAKHKRASWSAFPQHLEEQQCGSTHGSSPCTPLDTRKSRQLRSRSFSIENLDNSVGGSSENLKKSKRKGGFGSMRFTPSFLRGSASSIKELFSGIGGKNRGSSDSLHQYIAPQPLPQVRRNSLGNHQHATGKLHGAPGGLRDPALGLPIACSAGTFDGGHPVDGCCVLCGNDSSLHSTIGCRRMRGTNMAPSSRVDTREGNSGTRCGEFTEEVIARKWTDFADGGGCRNSGVFTVPEEDENETSFERMTGSNDLVRSDPNYENISANKALKVPSSRSEPREQSRTARVLFAQPKSEIVRSSKVNGHSVGVWSGSSSSKMLLDPRLMDSMGNGLPHNGGEIRRAPIDAEPRARRCESSFAPGPAVDARFAAPCMPSAVHPNSIDGVPPQCSNPSDIHRGSSGGFVPNPIYLNDYPVVRDRSNSVAVGYRDGQRLMNGELVSGPWPTCGSGLDPATRNCRNSGGSCDDIRISSRAFPAANGLSNTRETTSNFFDKENIVPEPKHAKKLSKSSSFKQSFSFMNAKSFFPKLESKKKSEKVSSSKIKLCDSKNSKDGSTILGEKSLGAPSSSTRCSDTTFEDCDDNGFSSFVNDMRRRSLRCSAAVDFIRTPSKRSLFTRGPLRSSAKSASHSHHSNTSGGTDQLSFHSVDHSNSSTKLDTSFSYLAFNRRRFNKLTGSSRSTQSAPAYAVSSAKSGIESHRDSDRWQHESVEERPEDVNRSDDSDLRRDVGNCSAFTSEPNSNSARCYENFACGAANGYVVRSQDQRDSECAPGLSQSANRSFNIPEDACCETVSPVVDKPTKVTPMKANKRKKRRTKKKQRNPEKTAPSSSQGLSKEHPNEVLNSNIKDMGPAPWGNSVSVSAASDCVDGKEDFFQGLQDKTTSVLHQVVSKSNFENSKQPSLLPNAQHSVYPQGLAPASNVSHSWSTRSMVGHPALGPAHPPLQAAASAPAQYCCGATPSCCPHTWVPNGACCGDVAAVVPECCASSSPMNHAYRNCQMNCSQNPIGNIANSGSYPLSRVAPFVGFERSLSSPGTFQVMPWTSGAQLGVNSCSSGDVGSSMKYPVPVRPIPLPEESHEGMFHPQVMSGLPATPSGVRQQPATPSKAITRLRHQNKLIIDLPKDPLSPCLSSASYASPSFFRDTFPEPHLNEEYSAPLDIAASLEPKHDKTATREAGVMYMQPLDPGVREVAQFVGRTCSEIQSPAADCERKKSHDRSSIPVREKRSAKHCKPKPKVTPDDIDLIGALRNASSSESRFYNCSRNSEPLGESSGSLASVHSANRVPRSSLNFRRESVGVCIQKSSPLSSNYRSLSCQSINQSYSSIEQSSRSIHQSNQSIHPTAQRNFLSGSSCQSLAQSAGCRSSSSLASCLSQASCESEVHGINRAVESGSERRSDSTERFSESSSVLGLADLYNSNKDLSHSFSPSGNCIANSQCKGSTMISQMSVKSRSSKMKKALIETAKNPCPSSNDSNEPFYENHGSLSVNRFFFDEHIHPGTETNRSQTALIAQSPARDSRNDVPGPNGSATFSMSLQRVGGSKLESSNHCAAQSDSAIQTRHHSDKVDRSLYSFFPMAHCSTFPGTDSQLDDRISEIYFRPGGRHSKPSDEQINSESQSSFAKAVSIKSLQFEEVRKSSEGLKTNSHGTKNSNEKITPPLPLRESAPPPLPPPLPRSVLDAVARFPPSSQRPSSSLPALPPCSAAHGVPVYSASHPSIPPHSPHLVLPLNSRVCPSDQPLQSPSVLSSQKYCPNSLSNARSPRSSTNNIPEVSLSQTCHSDGSPPCSSVQFASLPPSLRQPKSPRDHSSGLGKSKSCGDASSSSSDGQPRVPFSRICCSEMKSSSATTSGVASAGGDDATEHSVSASSPVPVPTSPAGASQSTSPGNPQSSCESRQSSGTPEILYKNEETSGNQESKSSPSPLSRHNSASEDATPQNLVFTNEEQFQRLKSDLVALKADDHKLLVQLLTLHAHIQQLSGRPFVSPPPSPPTSLRPSTAQTFLRGLPPTPLHSGSTSTDVGQVTSSRTEAFPSSAESDILTSDFVPTLGNLSLDSPLHASASSAFERKSSSSSLLNGDSSDPIHASLSELGLSANPCDRDYENVDHFSDILPACGGVPASSSRRCLDAVEHSAKANVSVAPLLVSRKVSSASEILHTEGPSASLCKRSASYPHCPATTNGTASPVPLICFSNTKEDTDNLPPCPDRLRNEVVTALLQSQQLQRGPDGEVQDGSNLVTVL